MFTLKFFKRTPTGQKITKIVPVHHVQVMTIGEKNQVIEIWAFHAPEPSTYDTYFVGVPEEGMIGYQDVKSKSLHLNNDWWGWGLLENWEGNTSEHFRPASYG